MDRLSFVAGGIIGTAIIATTSLAVWETPWFHNHPQTLGEVTVGRNPTPTPTIYAPIDTVPSVTAESPFSPANLPSNLDPAKLYTVVTTGDIIPARGVDMQIRAHGVDYPFAGNGVKELLSQADETIVNLESPLILNCPATKDGFTFCGNPDFAGAMAQAGIDVATLDNNHIGNYGTAGINETIQHLTAAGIDYASANRLSIKTIKGYKIGVLAFTGVGGRFYPDDLSMQIKMARAKVDLLLVAFHWGKEYELVPTPDAAIAPDDPRAIGRLAIDSGADLVIGNHPHWVQGVEVYKGKFISYASGNFIFDQSWSTETEQGVVGRYTFYGNKLIKVEYIPVHIDHQSQPRLADPTEAAAILGRMKSSTEQINKLGTP